MGKDHNNNKDMRLDMHTASMKLRTGIHEITDVKTIIKVEEVRQLKIYYVELYS